jgi:hypothetical protein
MMPAIRKRAVQPEIRSPDCVDRRWTADDTVMLIDVHRTQRLDVARFGQMGLALLALAMMISTMFLFFSLVSVLVIWIPVVVVFASGSYILGVFRRVR